MNTAQQLSDILISEITKLPENDFSKTVLVPLFKALGFRQVDFHGGPYEGGKDLVLWREDAFGDAELTVVQVKKVKIAAAVSGGHSYPEIVTQLAQAATKPVPTLVSGARLPDKLVFVTPYAIGTREIEQGFEQADVLRGRGIRVYDGHKIADLLLKKLPKLAEQLIGTEILIPQQINDFPFLRKTPSSSRQLPRSTAAPARSTSS